MAGIFAHIEDDIAKIRRLKNEIKSVKTSLKGINIKVDIDIKAGLEKQLKTLNAEYTALANKIAETEGRVTNSVNKINQATEKIVQQQQKIVSNIVNSENIADSTASQTQQVSNEALSASYDELKQQIDAVLGSRMANIKRLIEEKNAIDVINSEIKELNKAQKDNGFLTSDQSARLDKLNSELFERKQVISTLTSTIKMQTKEEQASVGSMNQLSAQLDLLRRSYRALTEEQKNSPMGKSFLSAIEQADSAIKGLDGSIGNYQRNVGNYARGWNGLNFSIQQLARESPSLAYGPQIFFSAISNNLPILADEIKRAKEEYNAFKAAGQQATPVWKQILSSLVSWQTALTVGITLLTIYGKEIWEWTKSLLSANSELDKMREKLTEMSAQMSSAIQSEVAQVNAMFEALKRAKKGSNEYKVAHDAIMKNYGTYLKDLKNEKDELLNLETAYLRVADAIRKTAEQKALNKVVGEAQDEYVKAIDKHTRNILQNLKDAFDPSGVGKKIVDDYYALIIKDFEEVGGLRKNTKISLASALGLSYKDRNQSAVYREIYNSITEMRDAQSLFDNTYKEAQLRLSKAQNEYIDLSKNELNALKNNIIDAMEFPEADGKIIVYNNGKIAKSFRDRVEAELALSKIETALKQTGKRVEAPDKERLKAEEKAQKELIKQAKQQNKYDEILEKHKQKRLKETRDNEIERRQLEIDLKSESSAKRIAQISLDYLKENATIQDWEEELRRTKIEEAKETFEADPRNKDKVFDPSTVDTSLTKDEYSLKAQKEVNAFFKLINDLFNANNAISDREQAANAEYVRQYGTYLEKKNLLLREHNEKLAKIRENGGGENAIKLENANYEASLQELEVIFGKTTNKINALFVDTRGKSVKELRKIAEEARKALNWVLNNEFDSNNIYGITQEQYSKLRDNPSAQKDVNDSIDEIESKANSLDDAFGLLKEGIDKTFDSDNLEDFKDGLENIFNAVGKITSALDVVSGALSSLGAEGAAEVVGEVSNVLNTTMQGAKAGSAFGSVGAAIGGAIGLVGSLGGALTKLHDKKHEKTIIKLQEQIDALAETYDDLSDNVEKAYSHDAQGLIEDQNKLLEQQKILIRQQIKEEEEKKKTDKERIKEWENELKEIDKLLEENKEKAIDAIFGEDLQTAIENFASAYADAVASGDGSWKSAKDYAKNMMKQMVVESIKSATQSSNAIGLIRSKLLDFYKDGVLSATEQAWVYNATEKAMKEIESQFGWADSLLKNDSAMQEASSKGLASLTQEQGDELNGRFTALQLAGERIAYDNTQQTEQLTLLNATTTDLKRMGEQTHNSLSGIADQIALSYLELQEINENTEQSAKALKAIQSDIAEVKKNTSKL